MNIALIVAAGKGSRMRGPVAKQYLQLAGQPVIVRTLAVFDRCPQIDEIYLVAPAKDRDYCREKIVPQAVASKPVTVVSGAGSRQESVHNGLKAIASGDHWVAIHDGVRPFVTGDQISACLEAARVIGACVLALPVSDTLKEVGNGVIRRTRRRESLWLAQTPQVFRLREILQAHEEALRESFRGTDDAALIERIGGRVAVIPGSLRNLKITTAEDLALARALAYAEACGTGP